MGAPARRYPREQRDRAAAPRFALFALKCFHPGALCVCGLSPQPGLVVSHGCQTSRLCSVCCVQIPRHFAGPEASPPLSQGDRTQHFLQGELPCSRPKRLVRVSAPVSAGASPAPVAHAALQPGAFCTPMGTCAGRRAGRIFLKNSQKLDHEVDAGF